MGNSYSSYDDYYYDPYYRGHRMNPFGSRYRYMPNYSYYGGGVSPFNYGYHQPVHSPFYYQSPTYSPFYQGYSPTVYYR
ncbi:unnamed protein product [Cunninghamella blakesleeana]